MSDTTNATQVTAGDANATPVVTPPLSTPASGPTTPLDTTMTPHAGAPMPDPLPTGVMPRPMDGRGAQVAGAPVVGVVPKLDEHTGPITKRQRAFFATPPRMEVSGSRRAPLVPLPRKPAGLRPSEQVEMSGGVLVIERTSPAWIATGVVAAAGLVVALVLGLDASGAKDALAHKETEVAELTKKLAAIEIPKVVVPVNVPTAAPVAVTSVQPVADAVRARAPEAKLAIDGAQLTIALENVLDKKGKLTKKGADVLGRVGAALGPLAQRIDVVAYSDGNVAKGKSEWGQSAARATSVARALAESRAVDPKKIAVVGKGAPQNGTNARRVEIVVRNAP